MSDSIHVLRLSPLLFRQGVWPVAFDPMGGLQTQVWRITNPWRNKVYLKLF